MTHQRWEEHNPCLPFISSVSLLSFLPNCFHSCFYLSILSSLLSPLIVPFTSHLFIYPIVLPPLHVKTVLLLTTFLCLSYFYLYFSLLPYSFSIYFIWPSCHHSSPHILAMVENYLYFSFTFIRVQWVFLECDRNWPLFICKYPYQLYAPHISVNASPVHNGSCYTESTKSRGFSLQHKPGSIVGLHSSLLKFVASQWTWYLSWMLLKLNKVMCFQSVSH